MTIRLHPATTHGDRLHRLGEMTFTRMSLMRVRRWKPEHVDWTVCGVPFVWGSWKGDNQSLPHCVECWS